MGTIERPVVTKDGAGGIVTAWEPAFGGSSDVWVAIEPLTGTQYFAAKQVMSEVTHRLTMRYLSGVLPSLRLTFSGRHFAFVSVINPYERNRDLVIMATEVVSP